MLRITGTAPIHTHTATRMRIHTCTHIHIGRLTITARMPTVGRISMARTGADIGGAAIMAIATTIRAIMRGRTMADADTITEAEAITEDPGFTRRAATMAGVDTPVLREALRLADAWAADSAEAAGTVKLLHDD